MPQIVIVDEIGTEAEALACRTIAERGVQVGFLPACVACTLGVPLPWPSLCGPRCCAHRRL